MSDEDASESADNLGMYRRGNMTLDELQQAINQEQEKLAQDHDALKRLGITADELRSVVYIARTPSGLDPATLLVVILVAAAKGAGAGAGTYVAKKAWSAVVNRLRSEHGKDKLEDVDPPRKDE